MLTALIEEIRKNLIAKLWSSTIAFRSPDPGSHLSYMLASTLAKHV